MNIRQFVEQLVIRQKSFAYDPQRFTSYEKYSTDEQVIGEWIDGGSLYRKDMVFNVTLIAGAFVDVPTGLTEDCIIRHYKVSIKAPNGATFSTFQLNALGLDFSIGVWMDKSTHLRMLAGKSMGGEYSCVATIEYTKTTN